MTAGNQRHRDPGADPQCTGSYDCNPTDISAMEGQQHPLHETEAPDLLAAVRPTGRILAKPGGKKTPKRTYCFWLLLCQSEILKSRFNCWFHLTAVGITICPLSTSAVVRFLPLLGKKLVL